jgi:hypothetical protein
MKMEKISDMMEEYEAVMRMGKLWNQLKGWK